MIRRIDFEPNRELFMDQKPVIWVRMWRIFDLFWSYLIGNSLETSENILGLLGMVIELAVFDQIF